MTSESEKIYYHFLNIISESNFAILSILKKRYGSWENIWKSNNYEFVREELKTRLKTIPLIQERKRKLDPEKVWEKMKKQGIELIMEEEENYPLSLKEIFNPPFGIYKLGEFDDKPKIAIVGTRKLTEYGKRATKKLAGEISQSGMTIISGLASGVDTIAHQSAIEQGAKTIAVLGSGINQIFPPENVGLAKKISNQGCLISEYPPETIPARHQFPARNRIVSALSIGVLIVEAPERSGALITANIAIDQNKEIFALPGSIFNQKSIGPNDLIKQGAKLVSSVDDILEELSDRDRIILSSEKNSKSNLENLSADEILVLKTIRESENISMDKIIEKCGLGTQKTIEILTILELKNLVSGGRDGYWIL